MVTRIPLRSPEQLIDIATRDPGRILRAMGIDCAKWRCQPIATRRAAMLEVVNGESWIPVQWRTCPGPGLADPILGGTSAMAPAGAVLPARFATWDRAAGLAVALLDAHCAAVGVVTSPTVRAAGLASAYTTASSYTNGPTLLAAALAFAGGYAASRFLGAKRR